MNADIVKKWVDALESGEYLQTTGCLIEQKSDKKGDCAFCAVGVLVDLYVQAKGKEWRFDNSDPYGYMNGYYMTLPPEVIEWAGITMHERNLIEMSETSVVGLNDNCLKTFPEIAMFIKEKFQ
jgi:hypothetical protein